MEDGDQCEGFCIDLCKPGLSCPGVMEGKGSKVLEHMCMEMLEDLCKEVLEDLCKDVLEEKQSTPTVGGEEISNVMDTEFGDNFGEEDQDMCQGV